MASLPNFNALLMDGFNAGREIKRQEGERNALAGLVSGDQNALGTLASYNPQMAFQINEGQQDRQLKQQQMQAQLSKQQQDLLDRGNKAVGQAALIVAQQPPGARAQAWDGVIDQLVQQGWTGLARYKGQYSEQALQAVIAQAGLAGELRQATQPSYQVIPEGGTLVNTRDAGAVSQFGAPQSAPPVAPSGIPNGSPLSPAPQAVPRPSNMDDAALISQARAAIAGGADANEVFKRLRAWGVQP